MRPLLHSGVVGGLALVAALFLPAEQKAWADAGPLPPTTDAALSSPVPRQPAPPKAPPPRSEVGEVEPLDTMGQAPGAVALPAPPPASAVTAEPLSSPAGQATAPVPVTPAEGASGTAEPVGTMATGKSSPVQPFRVRLRSLPFGTTTGQSPFRPSATGLRYRQSGNEQQK